MRMSAVLGLVLFDVDGTLTRVRSVWQYILEAQGRWDDKGRENLDLFLDGTIDYEEFCHRDAELLAGVRYEDLVAIAANIPLNPGVSELFSHLRRDGYKIALVSTGLRVLTGLLELRLPVDACVANDFEVVDGVCTGRAVIEIDDAEKGIHARRLIELFDSSFTVAIGDGSGDIPMFLEADLSIAIGDAAPSLIAIADLHHPTHDLTGVAALIDARRASMQVDA